MRRPGEPVAQPGLEGSNPSPGALAFIQALGIEAMKIIIIIAWFSSIDVLIFNKVFAQADEFITQRFCRERVLCL